MNSLDNDLKEAQTNNREGCPGVLWVKSTGPLVIKLLQQRNGQKKRTNLQLLVIFKQNRNVRQRGYRKRMHLYCNDGHISRIFGTLPIVLFTTSETKHDY